jgi:hypothetical protein
MFEPLNDLERLLKAAATDPILRAAFDKAVLEAKLYVSPLGPPDAGGQLPGLRATRLADGADAVAMFTAPERLVAILGREALIMTKDGATLLNWLRAGPIALNPGHEVGVVWSPDDLSLLLGARH